ncbi:MAG: tetraacyldisaccharide 4'-kinase [Gammaproteobacteria bacterium]
MARRKIHAWLLRRWYGDRPIGLFIPLAGLFALLTVIRRWCYRHGILRVVKLPMPVIVVGNITVGGTGKTPFVLWLTQALQKQGYRLAIITRGYGGKSGHWPLLVTPQTDPAMAGDEAVLLARRTGVPVSAGPDRVQAARHLLRQITVDVIMSDDGLQHYHLGRNLSVIMLDGRRYLGNGWRLPAGPLRESAALLDEADLVICKVDSSMDTILPANVFAMQLSLKHAISILDGEQRPLTEFAGLPVHALAGIGHPQQFFDALKNHGLLVDGRALPDHVEFSQADLTFDDDAPVLMTEKDAIKCRGQQLPHHWYVPASAEFNQPDTANILKIVRKKLIAKGVKPTETNNQHNA